MDSLITVAEGVAGLAGSDSSGSLGDKKDKSYVVTDVLMVAGAENRPEMHNGQLVAEMSNVTMLRRAKEGQTLALQRIREGDNRTKMEASLMLFLTKVATQKKSWLIFGLLLGLVTAADADATCPAGYHQPAAESTSCTACSVGKYQDKEGQAACKFAVTSWAVIDAVTWSEAAPKCAQTGMSFDVPSSEEQNTAIAQAGAGRVWINIRRNSVNWPLSLLSYNKDNWRINGNGDCLNIESNTWWDDEPCEYKRQALCANRTGCAAGRYGVTGASNANDACIMCPSGKYQEQDGQMSCELCNAGRFGQFGSCIDCPVGYFTATTGNHQCFDCASVGCNAGTWPDTASCKESATAQEPKCIGGCSPGTYQVKSSDADTSVAKCSTDNLAATLESMLNKGTCTLVKKIECSPCLPGLYQALPNAQSCAKCEVGKYTNRISSRECADCISGRYSDTTSSIGCVKCSAGRFQVHAGKTSCVECVGGRYANVDGVVACIACAVGQYSTEGATECAKCSAGRFGDSIRPQNSSIEHCRHCGRDKVQKERGKPFCNDVRRSAYVRDNQEFSCPFSLGDEAVCSFGILEYKPGFWHDGLNLTHPKKNATDGRLRYEYKDGEVLHNRSKFYRCRGHSATCTVDRYDGSVTCSEGNYGVLCGVCAVGYTMTITKTCDKCAADGKDFVQRGWVLMILVTLLFIFAGALLMFAWKRFVEHGELPQKMAKDLTSKLKIMTAYFSIVLLIGDVYDVSFPIKYLNVLGFFSIFEFDLLRIFKVPCFVDYDGHTAMYGLSVVLLLLLFIVIAGLARLVCELKHADSKSTIRQAVGFLLPLTYLVYPFACKLIFATFNCDTVSGVPYLHTDLRIRCDSDKHRMAEAFAGFMVIVFPVGLPMLYFIMLWANCDRLHDNTGHPRKEMAFLAFFYREYEQLFFYWETVECLRKLLLMGFANFFQPGSLMQLITAMIITVVYGHVLCIFKPYKKNVDNVQAIWTQLMLFFTLLGALMVKFEQGFLATGIYEDGYTTDTVNAMLIGSTLLVPLEAFIVVLTTAAKDCCSRQVDKLQEKAADSLMNKQGNSHDSEQQAGRNLAVTGEKRLVV